MGSLTSREIERERESEREREGERAGGAGRGRGRGERERERERETIKVIALYPCIVIASLAATKELRLWKDNASARWGSRPPDPAFGNYNLLFLNFKVSTGCLTLQDISRPSAFMSTQGLATYL